MITDTADRYRLANELHARPFPSLQAPCRAAYLALKQPKDAAQRDRDDDRRHLVALLDRFGAPHPQPGATHYFGEIGKHRLKWESHTEFVTYTAFGDGVSDRPFHGETFDLFPADWLSEAPGERMTSALIRIERMDDEDHVMAAKLADWFVAESVAASRILDGDAILASDFRIDPSGHIRLAVFMHPEAGPRLTGRVVQSLAEIETYKTMSMMGLMLAREMTPRINAIEEELSRLVGDLGGSTSRSEETLQALLNMAAELENLSVQSSFRFGATGAYEALVHQKTDILREERFAGRQTLNEFMMRRFDPAMRTVKAAERRLTTIANRAIRAGDLLRTRVDVERSAQNQALLASMDRRADLQLRLQRTVEGLSVVAISYYAVSLALYLMAPLGENMDLSEAMQGAIVTPPVVLIVWLLVRRIRRAVE